MTLFSYIFRQYFKWFSIVFLSFSSIVALFDYFELFRRARNKSDVGFVLISKMVLFHYPDIIKQLIPLIALFSSLLLFWKLGRSSQLVIMRISGANLMRLLSPIFTFLALYTALDFGLFNGISAQMMQKFETYNNQVFKGRASSIQLSSSGLWLREPFENKYALVQVKSLNLKQKNLNHLSLFIFSEENNLLERIEASQAVIQDNHWVLKNVTRFQPNRLPQKMNVYEWPTGLDLHSIENQFLGPDTISFWKLKHYIRILQEAGLSTTKYEMQWQSTLSRPLLMLTMALLGAFMSFWVMQRHMKFSIVLMIILFAYVIYVLFNVVGAMGQNHTVPVLLAAWAPPLMSLFFISAVVLHYEERV